MATCPLCSERPAKRYCPAKDDRICAVCCGTKREIEIDCPSTCSYLKASRSYELEKPIPDPEIAARVGRFDQAFIERYHSLLDVLSVSIVQERMSSSWLVDHDVIEVLKSLKETLKTLAGGIYYEALPDGPTRQSLFRGLKEILDSVMQVDPAADREVLRVSEAIDVLDFLIMVAQLNSSVRPKSRRYLDFITERYGQLLPGQQPSGLIIP